MRLLVLFFMMIWTTVAHAETKLVAVLEFRGIGMDPQMMMQLSEAARGGARSALPNSEYNITSRESMKAMLEDMGKDLSACDVECEVELGRVLQSDYVISGTIGKIDNMYILTLKLHDTLKGSLMGQKTLRDTDKFVLLDQTGPETKALVVENIALASNQLTGKKVSVTFKSDYFTGKPTMITVGGTVAGTCTKSPCPISVPEGRYEVQFSQEGYAPEKQTLDLKAKQSYDIQLKASFALLRISTEPERTTITLTEGPEGFSEIDNASKKEQKLDPGKYKATVQDKCYEPSGKYITLNPGDDKDIQISLQPRESGLNLITYDKRGEPIQVDFYVDDMKFGTTPWQGAIPLCTDQITIKHNGKKTNIRMSGENKLKERKITTIETRI